MCAAHLGAERVAADPYARDIAIRQFETFISIGNSCRRGRYVAVAHQDPKPSRHNRHARQDDQSSGQRIVRRRSHVDRGRCPAPYRTLGPSRDDAPRSVGGSRDCPPSSTRRLGSGCPRCSRVHANLCICLGVRVRIGEPPRESFAC
ncbi:hypothetical protein L210DRAFT_3059807 [Boletus edulis BED1]|uniref:Uncharacterized protein n=1 Tax=Boletus edulis BED1 TaxID=1328754 RepID=A0AAD4C0J1_BOLED|nr:hypothetical protein L210DRAFT_3059807 [Boletus edulis BED1]